MKEGRFQGGEEGQAKRASLGEIAESMSKGIDAKGFQENLEEPAHKMTK